MVGAGARLASWWRGGSLSVVASGSIPVTKRVGLEPCKLWNRHSGRRGRLRSRVFVIVLTVVVISFLICSRYKRAHATSSYGACDSVNRLTQMLVLGSRNFVAKPLAYVEFSRSYADGT